MSQKHPSQPCEEWAETLAMVQAENIPLEEHKALAHHLHVCQHCNAAYHDYRFLHEYTQRSLIVEPPSDLPADFFHQRRIWKYFLKKHYQILLLAVFLMGCFTLFVKYFTNLLLTLDGRTAFAITLAPGIIVSAVILIGFPWKDWQAHRRAQQTSHSHTRSFLNHVLARKDSQMQLGEVFPDTMEEAPLVTSTRSLAIKSIKRQKHKRGWRDRNIALAVIFVLLINIIASGTFLFTPTPPVVTNLQDSGPGSLRQIIAMAQSGSTITFAPTLKGTILLTSGDLNLNKNVTLAATGNKNITISSGSYGHKVHISPGSTVLFTNLTFSNSTIKNSSFIVNEGRLTLTTCFVTDNISFYDGGGIANEGGSLTINNSTISRNRANEDGGGIFNRQGTLTVTNSKISNNTSYGNGGGIYSLVGNATVIGSTISGNSANTVKNHKSNGGGIDTVNSFLTVTKTSIQNNHVQGDGGGITVTGSQAILNNTTITHNDADNRGGGIAVIPDSDNGYLGQVMLNNIFVGPPPTAKAAAIEKNHAPRDEDIWGKRTSGDPSRSTIISEGVSETNADLTESTPEQSPQFLGMADINAFCLAHGYSGGASTDAKTAYDVKCLSESGQPTSFRISGAQICQWQYGQSDAVDRLADYYDPSSWQCYAHEKRISGPTNVRNLIEQFCHDNNQGDATLIGSTAYDWKCTHPSTGPLGLSMLLACRQLQPDAMDRMADFNDPYSWQCWAPTPK